MADASVLVPVGTLGVRSVHNPQLCDPTKAKRSSRAVRMARHGMIDATVARARRVQRYLWHEPNPLVQIFYLLLVVGGYGAFLLTGLPHLPNAFLSEWHIGVSCIVVLLAMHSFILASTTTPGILTPQTIPFFDNYALDGVLYAKAERNCITCKTTKIARSKHCAVCNICVPRFDHHCVWINACIGERNHRHFLYYLVANVVLCAYGSYVLFYILYDEFLRLHDQPFVDAESGRVVQGVLLVELRFLIHAESVLFVLWSLCALMGLAVLAFFLFHCYLVVNNMTTNEFFKRRSLRAAWAAQRKQRDDIPAPLLPHPFALGRAVDNVKEVFSPRCDQRLREHIARRAKAKAP